MKRSFYAVAGLLGGSLVVAASAPACSAGLSIDLAGLPDSGFPEGGQLPDGAFPTGPGGVGAACDATNVCRPGLTCGGDGTCAPGRATAIGGDCQISAECNNGFCDSTRKCVAAGTAEANATCTSDGDCKSGLRCNLASSNGSVGAVCQPEGAVDLFGACTASPECFGGLLCLPNPQANDATQCLPTQAGIIDLPKTFQVACDAPATADVESYFDVPRATALKDFFRLPFPNDIRSTGSGATLKPNYKDFPVPGVGILGFDAVDRWTRHLEKTGTGFSAYPAVTFRFSGSVDFASLNADKTTHYVDLTEQQEIAHNWGITSGRNAYVCENAITFRPALGQPLKPGHTYAAYFLANVKGTDGKAIKRGTDFAAMLGASDPGGELSASWTKYKLFRDWLTAKTIVADTILNAAVFTVGQVDKPGRDMGEFVEAATSPGAWTKCDTGTTSPCAQHDGGRNCPANPVSGIDEYHAVIKLPQYQKGTVPFIKPEDDGTFVPGTKQGTIDVCASITIPTGATTDVPVLVYAHGTGGSFRSQSNENVAGRLAAMGAAVLGIDQVAHGTRRGASTDKPENLFFNFSNPAAAQGNVLQGGADQVALVKFIQAGQTIGGHALSTTKIAYWGHSQGATEGAISMPYAKGVKGVLFSGEGGSLIDSLITKTSPVNLKAVAPFVISESAANINADHPVLTLFQNGIDIADPLNHASNMNPLTPVAADVIQKHVFMPFGQGDTYATPVTQLTYLTAARLAVAPTPAGVSVDVAPKLPAPQAGPVSANSNGFTAVTRQYAKPAADDGHFVIFRDDAAKADGDKFLKAVLVDGTVPTLP